MAVDSDAVICEGEEQEETCEKGSESESEMEEYVKAPIGLFVIVKTGMFVLHFQL